MKIRCFIAMSMLALCGCNHSHQKAYSSFDEYPFFEGKWEEMVYSLIPQHYYKIFFLST